MLGFFKTPLFGISLILVILAAGTYRRHQRLRELA